MVTYLYWISVFVVVGAVFFGVGIKGNNWKVGSIVALLILLLGWGFYYFRLEQVFVKKYGGVMSIRVPEGQYHITATWKDENLWIENYDPKTNTCIFSEYSKGNLLQGKVTIKNCNPIIPQGIPGRAVSE
ncbi:MAG: hypothetical protein JKY62_10320 [Desulfocapsa sp.]|uniref:Uncharacterized protein n=1 Tax=Desulfotalea psychrophila TaxID=84980 RepID=A0ABS3AT73_9BACT|nr:hypothetical protein [Desulfocapsa sp.]MBN4045900.1 hypothetical protein [bacterium AH-315-P11]MBN4060090.1 hypothetical protein [Desulfotalea psychrophila]MBN4068301.1 hypothetical protein [Desulfotalea psychrophila]